MNQEKISRLIQLLVEREVKRLIPTIKKQILSEMNRQPTQQSQPKKQYAKNSFISELIASARPPVEHLDFDSFEVPKQQQPVQRKQTNQPLSHQQMLSTMASNPEARIQNSQAVVETLDIMNRDYSGIVRAMNKKPSAEARSIINPIASEDEDLSWLNEVQ